MECSPLQRGEVRRCPAAFRGDIDLGQVQIRRGVPPTASRRWVPSHPHRKRSAHVVVIKGQRQPRRRRAPRERENRPTSTSNAVRISTLHAVRQRVIDKAVRPSRVDRHDLSGRSRESGLPETRANLGLFWARVVAPFSPFSADKKAQVARWGITSSFWRSWTDPPIVCSTAMETESVTVRESTTSRAIVV